MTASFGSRNKDTIAPRKKAEADEGIDAVDMAMDIAIDMTIHAFLPGVLPFHLFRMVVA